MSSRTESVFHCAWRGSRQLLGLYASGQLCVLLAIWLSAAPIGLKAALTLALLLLAGFVIPRLILRTHPAAWRRLKLTPEGWQLWSSQAGWQSAQLLSDTWLSPYAIVLRFKLQAGGRVQTICLLPDSLSLKRHRQLRVRLRFSRYRWLSRITSPSEAH